MNDDPSNMLAFLLTLSNTAQTRKPAKLAPGGRGPARPAPSKFRAPGGVTDSEFIQGVINAAGAAQGGQMMPPGPPQEGVLTGQVGPSPGPARRGPDDDPTLGIRGRQRGGEMTRGAGGGGERSASPETFGESTIEKFGGMNTVSPRGVFGQPNLLENIVLDRAGGYAVAPSPRLVYDAPDTITEAQAFDGVNIVFLKTATGAHIINLMTGATLHTYNNPMTTAAAYERGVVATWDTGNSNAGLNVYSLADDGTMSEMDLISKLGLTFWVEELPSQPKVELGSDYYLYNEGTLYGFVPTRAQYLIIYPQVYERGGTPRLGTTLNPTPERPDKIRPIILRIAPYPNGIRKEYRLVIDNPTNRQLYIYGAARGARRTVKEYYGTANPTPWNRNVFSGPIPEGLVISRVPRQPNKSELSEPAVTRFVYQAVTPGQIGDVEPLWPPEVGATVQDNEVVWLNVGSREEFGGIFADYLAHVANAPADYIAPENTYNPHSGYFGTWGELYTEPVGSTLRVYPSFASTSSPSFVPASFFPAGRITELHLGRTWVVPDAVWRSYGRDWVSPLVRTTPGGVTTYSPAVADIENSLWETAAARRTIYYSEPDRPWSFQERFITPPLNKSREIRAMRSVGDYLILLGDSDAVVIMGDSEANFYVRSVDIPGAFSQETTCVVSGTLYYRGAGGVYQLQGGSVVRISEPVGNLIPHVPAYPESMSADTERGRIYFRVSESLILCYDLTAQAWTTLNTPGRLYQVGTIGYLSQGDKLYALDGVPDRVATIRYRDLTFGQPMRHKQFKGIHVVVEADSVAATLSLSTQVHRVNTGVSGWSPHKELLVNQRTQLAQFHTRDRHGYALDFEFKINPANGHFVVKPGITIEMQGHAIERKGYTNG